MRRVILATILAALAILAVPTTAQQPVFCPTRPVGDNTNACASTAFVQQNSGGGGGGSVSGPGTSTVGHVAVWNNSSGTLLADKSLSAMVGRVFATDSGVQCNGTTDDTINLQAAINSAAATGAVVVLPSGSTCVVSALTYNRALGGGLLGNNTRLIANTDNKVLIDVTGAVAGASQRPFVISGISFDGNGHLQIAAFRETSAQLTTITNSTFTNVQYAGIFFRGRAITLANIQQYGHGTWFFSGVGTTNTDYVFDINISNVTIQSLGGSSWESTPAWWYFYRSINVNMTNFQSASLDGAVNGIRIEDDCQGIFINNGILVFPIDGVDTLAGASSTLPTYLNFNNFAVDQMTGKGFDISAIVTRLDKVNVVSGHVRANTGSGIVVQSSSSDVTIQDTRIQNNDHTGLQIVPGAVVTVNNLVAIQNNQVSGFDVDIGASTFNNVYFYGYNTVGSFNATGQPILNGSSTFRGPIPPAPSQGRLTLTSGTPVLTSSVSAATTIYYTPYLGAGIALFDGIGWRNCLFPELSNITTNSSVGGAGPAVVAANSNYDLFVWSASGDCNNLTLTRGPAWASDTTRSAGTALVAQNGVQINNVSITNGPAASRGTYVGTVRSDASSKINFVLGGSAPGGAAAILGVWNMYNRVVIHPVVVDSNANWTTNSTGRASDNSTNNRINFVSGLAEDGLTSNFQELFLPAAFTSGSSPFAAIGVSLDITNFSFCRYFVVNPTTRADVYGAGVAACGFNPQLGYHFIQAVEGGDGTYTQAFVGTNGGASSVAYSFEGFIRM